MNCHFTLCECINNLGKTPYWTDTVSYCVYVGWGGGGWGRGLVVWDVYHIWYGALNPKSHPAPPKGVKPHHPLAPPPPTITSGLM